jgi:hypothetical protein
MPPPRIHVLPAADAPEAVVLRRGPSDWWHVLRWRLDTLAVEPGAWFSGRMYPRRCDVSPDGLLLGYFAWTPGEPPWDGYYAVSRVPWLRALAAWRVGSTWASGCEFHRDGAFAMDIDPTTPPDHGTFPGRRERRTSFQTAGRTAYVERDVSRELRNGWSLRPPAEPGPALAIERGQPSARGATLRAIHEGHDFDEHAIEGALLRYELDGAAIDGVVWADWDATGRLLVATDSGRIEVRERRDGGTAITWSHDLDGLDPAPGPAPAWAERW